MCYWFKLFEGLGRKLKKNRWGAKDMWKQYMVKLMNEES